jgi:hypothetical protein
MGYVHKALTAMHQPLDIYFVTAGKEGGALFQIKIVRTELQNIKLGKFL